MRTILSLLLITFSASVFSASAFAGQEDHMHGVKITLEGNKLKQEWTNFAKGKKDGTMVFDYTKKI